MTKENKICRACGKTVTNIESWRRFNVNHELDSAEHKLFCDCGNHWVQKMTQQEIEELLANDKLRTENGL